MGDGEDKTLHFTALYAQCPRLRISAPVGQAMAAHAQRLRVHDALLRCGWLEHSPFVDAGIYGGDWQIVPAAWGFGCFPSFFLSYRRQ